MATKLLAKHTKYEIGSGGNFTKISGVKSFTGLHGGSTSVIDSTDLDSDAKEKLPGLPDEGSITLTMDFMPADAGQVVIDAARLAGSTPSFRITLTTGVTYTMTVLVLSNDKAGAVDQLMTATAKLEISGAVVQGASA